MCVLRARLVEGGRVWNLGDEIKGGGLCVALAQADHWITAATGEGSQYMGKTYNKRQGAGQVVGSA